MTHDELAPVIAALAIRHHKNRNNILSIIQPITVLTSKGESPLTDLIADFKEPVEVFNLTPLGSESDPNLAGFRGYLGFGLRTSGQQFRFGTQTGLRSAMTGAEFAELVNAQSVAPAAWQSIEDSLSRNLELNNQPAIPSGTVQSWILREENASDLDIRMGDVLVELQTDVALAKTTFVIPPKFKDKLYRLPEDDSRFVVEVKWDAPTRGQDIVDLIDPQKDAKEIYKRFDQALGPLAEMKEVPPPVNWREFLISLTQEEAPQVFGFVAGVLNGGFGAKGFDIVIPDRLKPLFEPRKIQFESVRDETRASLRGTQWYMADNPNYTERTVMIEMPLTKERAPSVAAAREGFAKAFRAGIEVSKEMESPFTESLEICLSALDSATPPEGWEIFQTVETDKARRHLLYASIVSAGLFGGMGSWNDLPPNADPAKFQRVTTEMINARQDAIAAAVST